MSMHWNPGREPVTLKPAGAKTARPSIRREPPAAPVRQRRRRSDEEETMLGVAGVLAMAAAVVVLIGLVAWATYSRFDPTAAAAEARFGQCYNTNGPNCVVDGGTIEVARTDIRIAGLVAPSIDGARCEAERTQGIASAVRLVDLLNSGRVSIGPEFRDAGGRTVRKVAIRGADVRDTMIDEGLGRRYDPDSRKGWC